MPNSIMLTNHDHQARSPAETAMYQYQHQSLRQVDLVNYPEARHPAETLHTIATMTPDFGPSMYLYRLAYGI